MKKRKTISVDERILEEFEQRVIFENRNLSNLTEIAMAEYLGNRSGENWKKPTEDWEKRDERIRFNKSR